MTQTVVTTEHNVVNPVSTDSSGDVVTDKNNNPVTNVVIEGGGVNFTPSSYDADLTMDGTAQTGAIATGATKIQFVNLGATTEAIRVAFGTSASDAGTNLTIAAAAATTGYYIPAEAEGGTQSIVVLGVPTSATHYAVANAVAADTQDVAVNQGV